jgi:phage terminase Nu1 subunit (DNA packaging protein)
MPKKKARFDIQGDQLIVNADVMLEIMDCTPTMLTQYKKDGVMVQPVYGVYDLIPSIRNYLKKLKNKASAVTTEGVLDFHEEKARLTKMQADKAEMEVREMSGELVRVDDVLQDWESILMDCKGKLLSIPSKLATLVTDIENPAEAQNLIEDHIREALEELANYAVIRERQGNTAEGDGSTTSSSEADNL